MDDSCWRVAMSALHNHKVGGTATSSCVDVYFEMNHESYGATTATCMTASAQLSGVKLKTGMVVVLLVCVFTWNTKGSKCNHQLSWCNTFVPPTNTDVQQVSNLWDTHKFLFPISILVVLLWLLVLLGTSSWGRVPRVGIHAYKLIRLLELGVKINPCGRLISQHAKKKKSRTFPRNGVKKTTVKFPWAYASPLAN